MDTRTIRFERQKLYEQVWEKPMTTLASEYGLSDVGLRKICKRLSIPLLHQFWIMIGRTGDGVLHCDLLTCCRINI